MLALSGHRDPRGKIPRTLDYLTFAVSSETTSASLAWALLGLAAHRQAPPDTDLLLQAAFERNLKRGGSLHKIALLLLAAAGEWRIAND
jgi:cytochrome P450